MLDNWLVQGIIQSAVWAILVLIGGSLVAWMSTKSHKYATNALYGLAAAVLILFIIVQGKALYYSSSPSEQLAKEVGVEKSTIGSQTKAVVEGGPLKIIRHQLHPYEEGKKVTVYTHFKNYSPYSIKMNGRGAIFVSMPSKVQTSRLLENQFWSMFTTPDKDAQKDPEFSIPPEMMMFVTSEGPVLTSEQYAHLKAEGPSAVYIMGMFHYSDSEGQKWTMEYCGSFGKDERLMFMCENHNGPSRSH